MHYSDLLNFFRISQSFNVRLPTPLFSPPDTPDSIPDSLAPTPVSKLFLSDAFLDIREDWLHVNQEHMISLTHVSILLCIGLLGFAEFKIIVCSSNIITFFDAEPLFVPRNQYREPGNKRCSCILGMSGLRMPEISKAGISVERRFRRIHTVKVTLKMVGLLKSLSS